MSDEVDDMGDGTAGGGADGKAARRVVVLATMDTKGAECEFLRDEIARLGALATLVDIGVVDDPSIAVDHDAASVARRGGVELTALRDKPSRERASEVMVRGATDLLEELLAADEVDAVLSLGGTQGTANGCRVMGALPYGLPKIMLSTMASGDVSGYVGIKDITMMFSVADILGLNPFFRRVLANAAGAAVGMANASRDFAFATGRPVVGITNLGVLTRGTMRAMELLAERGHETIVFHAVGSGGRAMEQLMREGRIGAVLDLALGDLADALFGGIRAADENRLSVAAELGLPQVVSPGGTDHIGILLDEPNVVPEEWQGRPHTFHNPSILVPRPTTEELGQLAEEIGRRLSGAGANTVFLAPAKGLSSYSVPGGPLADEEGDAAFIRALRRALPEAVRVESVDAGAEDETFVRRAVDELVALMR